MISVRQASLLAMLLAALLTVVAVWFVVGSPSSVGDVGSYEPQPTPGDGIVVAVESGDGPTEIADNLERAGVIASGTRFRVLSQLMGFDRLLQAGTYDLRQDMPELDVLYRLRNGIVTKRFVTVVEGWQLAEIADAVAAAGIDRDDFLTAAASHDYDYPFLSLIPDGESLQGYLYPATYPLRTGDDGRAVVGAMLAAFDANVPDDLATQAAAVGLTLHEVVTLASIIEREAVVPEEKPIMAQVLLSRLRFGFRLEADPTVQFALAVAGADTGPETYWKTPLTTEDLAFDSLYNTYIYFGLPPGPISSPGADSIAAVLNPSETSYLFFVARPDGSHAFAETLAEHNANVELYRDGGVQ
ncbi:MAG: endolytic transglycosylase MltG [Chloroflexi bacterium]|nr:endolytic transglycosylase MltG [Chloroflexota bacterium]MCI0783464.1 endolytic transglycosylase MltG [Chloroflexota bacterium]MCI0815292.1 endolytic transglycosylase MltG [Chloroflexota bacterium]MCI0817024.1 endolytic transglycosylase MltG [Chloroflexota bacterium]MCI0838324.1 endolytic transglycosylase MltG [Chloroflexota bacterium]